MNDYQAELTAAAIEQGKIKEWPWKCYKAVDNDTGKVLEIFKVDSDAELAGALGYYNDMGYDYDLVEISKEEYEKLRDSKKSSNESKFVGGNKMGVKSLTNKILEGKDIRSSLSEALEDTDEYKEIIKKLEASAPRSKKTAEELFNALESSFHDWKFSWQDISMKDHPVNNFRILINWEGSDKPAGWIDYSGAYSEDDFRIYDALGNVLKRFKTKGEVLQYLKRSRYFKGI